MFLAQGEAAATDARAENDDKGAFATSASRRLGDERIPGIDLWRAVLMLGGIVLHASLLKRERLLFDAIDIASGSFRMGAFFVLSGLLTGMALRKQADPSLWFRRRLLRLGVPTLFGLLVICPLLNLAIDTALGPVFPIFSMHHLWFLVALLLYTGLVFLAEEMERRSLSVTRLAAAMARIGGGQWRVVLIVAGLSAALMAMTAGVSTARAGSFTMTPGSQIFGDAPMFLLGYLLSRSPDLRANLLRPSRFPLAVILTVALVYAVWFGLVSAWLAPAEAMRVQLLLRIVGAACCAPAAALLILRSAFRIRHVPDPLKRLAEASFTIYIVHYPILAVLNLGFKHIHWDPYLEYAVAGVIGGIASYGFHRGVVRRFGWARLLFNGEMRRPATLAT